MPTPTNYSYNIASDFPVTGLNVDRMVDDIAKSSIVTALDYIEVTGGTLNSDHAYTAGTANIWFKDALSAGDKTTLDNDTTGPSGGLIAAHTAVSIAAEISEVKIHEEDIPTGGHLQVYSPKASVSAGPGWEDLITISFPFAINVMAAQSLVPTANNDDKIEFVVGPDTTIGALSANEASGQTVLSVDQSTIDNVFVGAFVKLDDGTNVDDCGRVIAVDGGANTITVETATTNSFLAATPTYVKMSVKMGYDMTLCGGQDLRSGFAKTGGSYVPANTNIVLRYYNSTADANKEFGFTMEYLY